MAAVHPKVQTKLAGILSEVTKGNQTIQELRKQAKEKEKQIKKLRQEIAQEIGTNSEVTWNFHSTNIYPKQKSVPRTSSKQLLEIVEELYGNEKAIEVDELAREIHAKKYAGQFEVRLNKRKPRCENIDTESRSKPSNQGPKTGKTVIKID